MTNQSPIQLAILDDYVGIAEQYFTSPAIPRLQMTSFPETIDPETPSGLEELKTKLQPFNVISTMRERTPFPASLLTSLPNLRLLLTTGMRNASIDLETAKNRVIIVAGTTAQPPSPRDGEQPPPATHSTTTQQALSLLLSLTSRIPHDHSRLTNPSLPHAWQSGLSIPLYGKTLSVLGLGKLGTNFARLCVQAFDMKVLCWSENLTQAKADEAAVGAGLAAGTFQCVEKEKALREADVVSLHLVLSERSRNTLKANDLKRLKSSALIINTARAGLVNEDALLDVLNRGAIGGAALDVFWKEPLPGDSVWRKTKWGEEGRSMVVLSPHMGYVNGPTLSWWYEEQARVLRGWVGGEEVGNRLN